MQLDLIVIYQVHEVNEKCTSTTYMKKYHWCVVVKDLNVAIAE